MRLVAISDTHGAHRDLEVPKGDILIHCGDITGRGSVLEVFDFNAWLGELPHKYKIVVAGNHDECLEKAGYSLAVSYFSNATYLENYGCTISHKGKKYKIWGSPITPRFLDWHFMADFNKIGEYWDLIPPDTDILITHGPAYGMLDEIKPNDLRGHLGCRELIKRIEKIKPEVHLFGHIHGGYGAKKPKDTLFINCSTLNEDYEIANQSIVVDI